ncbi:diguanylate cyclase domain protein [Necator americanus]|uniref:Diguanylate cyclase domain protein n=1 Tax=Necator americanus TaxID=51031 RepID=W2TJY4_NECAM|nr:diguanylate cyclase domain protein [Necator americanus]ETN82390.1 diguanylate cyclase domain protein [Necator americanus]
MLGQPITDLLPERYRPNHSQYVHQFARSPVRSRQMDERNRVYGLHRDGPLLPVEIAISKINVGGLIEFTAVIRDITDRVQLMDLLQKQAVTDELTGLPNRREFTDIVDKLLESDNTLSVFILDIDYFKKINDSYGHDVGDEVLRVLAKVVMSSDCRIGVFARWGGEEYRVEFRVAALSRGRRGGHSRNTARPARGTRSPLATPWSRSPRDDCQTHMAGRWAKAARRVPRWPCPPADTGLRGSARRRPARQPARPSPCPWRRRVPASPSRAMRASSTARPTRAGIPPHPACRDYRGTAVRPKPAAAAPDIPRGTGAMRA